MDLNEIIGYVQMPAGKYSDPVCGVHFDMKGRSTGPVSRRTFRRIQAIFGQKAQVVPLHPEESGGSIDMLMKKRRLGYHDLATFLNRNCADLPSEIHRLHVVNWHNGRWEIPGHIQKEVDRLCQEEYDD